MNAATVRDTFSLHEVAAHWTAALDGLHARIAPRFQRAEVRARVRCYLEGLLGAVERKNGWQLAEHLGEAGPQGVQRLLNSAGWDPDATRDDLRAYVVEHLGTADGVLVIDETGFLKKGTKSAGVARQYSGTAGRRENQQVGTFLAYTTPRGCAFLDRALYLPEVWAEDADRQREAGVPEETAFATKGELARQGQRYALAVPYTHGIWAAGEQVEAGALADALSPEAWARLSAGEGSQGPRWYDWACLALPYEAAGGWAHWLLVRRDLADPAERAYYRVYAPAGTAVAAMVGAAGRRWCIEAGFEEAKGLAGLDQYEVRRWDGWHRHVTLCLLAHAALVVARAAAVAASEKRGAMMVSHP